MLPAGLVVIDDGRLDLNLIKINGYLIWDKVLILLFVV